MNCAPVAQDLTWVIALIGLLAGIIIGMKLQASSDPPP